MITAERSLPASAAARVRGFTMIELLVVLTLMGLLMALVMPTFGGGVSTTELKSTARSIASGLRFARGQAINQHGEALLQVDVAAHTFQVPPDTRIHPIAPGIDIKLFTAQRDLISDQVGAIRFFPDGGSNGGRITLAAGDRKYDVDVDWLTGRVAILE